jgi:hypothetical protein
LKIKLVTLYDEKFSQMGELSSRVMAEYCAARGYEFVCYKHLPDHSRGAIWNKTRVVQQELPTCDWLVWMDADTLPANHNFSFEKLIERIPDKDLITSGDVNGLCFGLFAVRNCAWSVQFFQTLWFVGQMDREYAKRYQVTPHFDQASVVALKENFPDIASRIFVLPENFVCNPHSDFIPDCFAVHYWSSGNPLDAIARKMNYYITNGWCPAAHRDLIIVTCSNAHTKLILERSLAQNTASGYEVCAYDLNGELGSGPRFDSALPILPKSDPFSAIIEPEQFKGKLPCKPQLIRRALKDLHQFIAYMDADAFAIRRFDEVNTGDYDVGVTMRRPEERGSTCWPLHYGFINAGVMFFNHTPATFMFIDLWEKEMAHQSTSSDQKGLNSLVLQATDLTQYDKVFNWNGIRIKVFKCDDYNFYYWPQEPLPKTKILHAKTDRRAAMGDWASRDWSQCKT